MANIQSKYGANNQPITITLAGLANGAARSSAAIDNTVNLFLDALVQLVLRAGGAGVGTTGFINVYAYGTTDGGVTYPEGAGTDIGVTLTVPPNARLIGVINMVAISTTYKTEPMSVAAAFGGVLPALWGIIIENKSGGALDAVEASHVKIYQGILAQSV